MAKSLIEAAYCDMRNAELILRGVSSDDALIDIAGYHLQQCAAKSLKAVLEHCGLDYREYGHSIGKCYRSVCDHASDVLSVESIAYLARNSGVLTDWEVAGRYPSDFVFELSTLKQDLRSVRQVFDECAAWLGFQSKDKGGCTSQTANATGGIGRLNLDKK